MIKKKMIPDDEVDIMTRTQAAALRVTWAERADLPCQHLHLELEHTDDGYLTGNYHCTACGESVMHLPLAA